MSKFHEDNKTAPPPGAHVFPLITTIFKLVREIYIANAKNVTSREKDPPGSHVFLPIQTIFELNCRNKFAHLRGETNVLSKFQENWAKNVTSTVFTCFHNIHIEKNAPPTGGHVFSPIPTIFILVRDINKTNGFTNFHDDWAKIVTSRVENCHYIHIEKNAPPTGGHVFSTISTIFELVRDIN
ncbi:hypothetical protein DPMN_040385 [Dreissena polymorpha]|uniref:Uncharacterized protein n=1 Tax=Dreissena polymorpha TaxID=45954 RepID=A0A9D4HWU2_DREPO|nr:hypothetical protein DPMN_040385 [Dreissena polymorpha]